MKYIKKKGRSKKRCSRYGVLRKKIARRGRGKQALRGREQGSYSSGRPLCTTKERDQGWGSSHSWKKYQPKENQHNQGKVHRLVGDIRNQGKKGEGSCELKK